MISKKILIALPSYSSYLPGLLRVFKYLNISVTVFDYRSALLKEKIQALIRPNDERLGKSINSRLIKEIEAYRPDLFFVMKGEKISFDTVTAIKRLKIPTINWFPEDMQNFKLAKESSKYYDLFFHFDPYALSLLKKLGRKNVYYLPFAADILPGDREPEYNEDNRDISIGFIGNYYPRREKYLLAIKDLKPSIWGDMRWEKSLMGKYYQGCKPIKEILPNIKIAINLQYDSPCQGLVLRVYEVLGSKGFLLTDARSEAKKLFHPGQDLVTFTSVDDFRQKIKFYLSAADERKKIATRGFATVRAKHTYVQRLNQMFKLLS